MSSPIFTTCTDEAALRKVIGPWLCIDASPYSLICDVASRHGAWCGVVLINGEPVVALAQTPRRPVIIASPRPIEHDAVACVVELLRQPGRSVHAINGPAPWSEAIAATQTAVVTQRMGVRLHRLFGQPRQPTCPPGCARPFTDTEDHLLIAWTNALCDELGAPRQVFNADAMAAIRNDVLAWTVDGRPVAMARRVRPFLGGWSVAGVYTPPALRRNGYAGAVVHAMSVQLLEEGTSYVVLYTDLGNPISNRVYARIGFEPVLDQTQITWDTP